MNKSRPQSKLNLPRSLPRSNFNQYSLINKNDRVLEERTYIRLLSENFRTYNEVLNLEDDA